MYRCLKSCLTWSLQQPLRNGWFHTFYTNLMLDVNATKLHKLDVYKTTPKYISQCRLRQWHEIKSDAK